MANTKDDIIRKFKRFDHKAAERIKDIRQDSRYLDMTQKLRQREKELKRKGGHNG